MIRIVRELLARQLRITRRVPPRPSSPGRRHRSLLTDPDRHAVTRARRIDRAIRRERRPCRREERARRAASPHRAARASIARPKSLRYGCRGATTTRATRARARSHRHTREGASAFESDTPVRNAVQRCRRPRLGEVSCGDPVIQDGSPTRGTSDAFDRPQPASILDRVKRTTFEPLSLPGRVVRGLPC
jgi:hypothetical protein